MKVNQVIQCPDKEPTKAWFPQNAKSTENNCRRTVLPRGVKTLTSPPVYPEKR